MSAEKAVPFVAVENVSPIQEAANDQQGSGAGFLLSGDFAHLQHAKIMMVDDEAITMRVLQSFLESAGYSKFHLVSDSVIGVDEVRKHKPDILLLDVMMPEVSGFDILKVLRNDPEIAQLPIIILTSSTDAETKLNALDLGATDFLAKPVDPSELALRVRNTLAAKAYQDQLTYYDALTHLPNSQLFDDRMSWAITRAQQEDSKLNLLHIVFNGHKRIIDIFGPKTGDDVLKQIAQRLSQTVRQLDLANRDTSEGSSRVELFRLEGSDFGILFPSEDSAPNVSAIGSRIIETMKDSLIAEGTEVYLEPSVGVASFPEDATTKSALFKLAAGASSQAVTNGGGKLEFYSAEMNERSRFRMHVEARLRQATVRDELTLLYQPKVSLKTGDISGAEALVRWRDGDNGIVSPADFIPIAEETGLIIPIGEWVIREACRQQVAWRAANIDIKMSVNISARQFFEVDIVELLKSVIQEYQLDPRKLVIEMTESILVDDVDTAQSILCNLRTLGVQISIDDFGTGYSSLSYLKMFKANEVKIDRAFITDIITCRDDQALLNAINYLAQEMGFRVCAEGVENSDQRDYLRKIGCDEFQGFYFSRPVLPDDIALLYKASKEAKHE